MKAENMDLKVYNSLTRKKEEFKPLHGKEVKMFVCGQTVYDDAHLGHAKTYVQFDIIARWLRKLGFNVFYVQNITDIEDKIINRAKESSVDPLELSKEYAQRYLEDLDALGVKKNVNLFPKTTDYITQMIEQIKTLIAKGYAYVVDGDVYYDVAKFKDYTELSRMPLEELQKHRIEPDKRKRNSFDFSLWKSQKPGELAWDSPWGKGRPGWHIEDTAMTVTIFNAPQYDLHGGATELIFPHHTNEIAQAEAATGKRPFVRYWLHTGVLQIGGVEMHKSLKNFITIREMLKNYDREVLRLYYASTHYRKPIDFNEEDVKQAKNRLETLYSTLRNLKHAAAPDGKTNSLKKDLAETKAKFTDAMNDDFNTPLALAHLFALSKKINKVISENKVEAKLVEEALAVFKELGTVLGILEGEIEIAEIPKEVEKLVAEREEARIRKDWKRADTLREEIKKLGFLVEDTSEGPRCIKIKN
jgi:cysteinyl-tRNA synthetase